MIKQNIAKLKLLIGGIIARFEENKDFFIGVEGEFVSGAKKYPFHIHHDEQYSIDFQNTVEKSPIFQKLLESLIEKACLFDHFSMIYSDRTGTIELFTTDKTVITKANNTPQEFNELNEKHEKQYLISPKKAERLLNALDFITKDGKIKNTHTRKYIQAENFIKLLIPTIEKLPKGKEICIYDLACGKSYLSFFLNYYLCDVLKIKCRIFGLDINEEVILASNKIKDVLKYHNMQFITTNILEFKPETQVDVAISLHACDVATDYAIATAVNNHAKIIAIAPCCHKELYETINKEELKFIFKYPIMKKRFSDIFTDVYRAETLGNHGYSVTMTEFVSPIDTPKNLLILAEKRTRKKENDLYSLEKEYNIDPILNKLLW